jgi:hypothetical protein
MRLETRPIKTLLLRIFLPAVLLVAALLAVFAYNWHYATILEGFDRKLVTTSALTGAMINPEDHDRLIDAARSGTDPDSTEQTREYERNAAPIRRILTQLDLTYLYSQATAQTSDIVYVLDGSIGDEHSPIGTPDDLTTQTLNGIRTAEDDGSIFVSPIEYQEQWGLLKTAAAPVYDSGGGISATAGADVDISVILIATQNALFASTLIGLGSIALCLLITFAIVRKVAQPIEALKDQALSIAAGESHSSSEAKGPREVVQLSRELSEMAAGFERSATERERISAEQNRRANADLILGVSDNVDGEILQILDHSESKVFWLPVAADCAKAALTSLAMRHLAQRFAGDAELAKEWRLLADTQKGVCIALKCAAGTIELVGNTAVTIIRGGTETVLKPGTPQLFSSATDHVKIGDGSAFLLPRPAAEKDGQP